MANNQQRKSVHEREAEMLEYWDRFDVFNRSVSEREGGEPFVFYDGPPFATGTPHYGHIVGTTLKDVIPRYWTMKGRHVERVWGWDCHGLPIENIIEKDLDLGSRQKIEEFGIAKFNQSCEARVLDYVDVWKDVIKRIGRWVDMDASYKTMDKDYMESVWWAFSELYKKDKLYLGYRPIHICPRCATTLSASEVGLNYKDIGDLSVFVKFDVVCDDCEDGDNCKFLAWTTTPWTLPGNMLLAVGEDIDYIKVRQRNECLILAKDRAEDVLEGDFEVVKELKGRDLIGKKYTPVFSYYADRERAFRVVAADFVSIEDGTGIVHIAPGFGEDDFAVGQREGLDIIRHINIEGRFNDEVEDFAGRKAKPSDNDIEKWLAGHGYIYKAERIKHSYPHCWRCQTALLNYATDSWFIRVGDIVPDMLRNNKETRWVPNNMRDGRFGKWLEGARDWSVSRNRYWGAPLPVWRAEDGEIIVVGSVAELEELSGVKVEDLHKHVVDEIRFEKDGKEFSRIPEVLDCWFESGSMPFAQMHYPFENKEKFEARHPADFIAEGQDQTRGWFYTLTVLSTILFDSPAFKNVIVNGTVLAEDGKKMSKSLQNYPDPMMIVDKYGADAMRFYLMSTPVVRAETFRFKEQGVKEVSNKLIGTLVNVLSFYQLTVDVESFSSDDGDVELGVMDRWILARLAELSSGLTSAIEGYEVDRGARVLQEFVTDLSQWYVRRSRERFKAGDFGAARTLREVLNVVSKLTAPYVPFISEYIYQGVEERDEGSSVHLEMWPEVVVSDVDQQTLDEMVVARGLVRRALEARESAGVPVRQALGKLVVFSGGELSDELLRIIGDEVNVLDVVWEKGDEGVDLDLTITSELLQMGYVREVGRRVNDMRKKAGLTMDDEILLRWESDDDDVRAMFAEYGEELMGKVRALSIEEGIGDDGEELDLKGVLIRLAI